MGLIHPVDFQRVWGLKLLGQNQRVDGRQLSEGLEEQKQSGERAGKPARGTCSFPVLCFWKLSHPPNQAKHQEKEHSNAEMNVHSNAEVNMHSNTEVNVHSNAEVRRCVGHEECPSIPVVKPRDATINCFKRLSPTASQFVFYTIIYYECSVPFSSNI